MEGKPKNLGRAYLVDKLRERGLSRRDSVRIVKLGSSAYRLHLTVSQCF